MFKLKSQLALGIISLLSVVNGQANPVETFAPIPEQALGPPLNDAGYRVQEFGGGAYMVTDNLYNMLFFVSTKGVIVVDAPPTIGKNFLYAIGNTTDVPVTHFVYSHSHADHVGGAGLFGSNVTYISHKDTKEHLAVAPDPNRPTPDITFNDHYNLCLGNQTLRLAYEGLNHSPGNILIHAPKQKVLMLVDVVFPGWEPFAFLGLANFVPGVIKAHDQVLAYDFKDFVGGHMTRSGTREDVEIAQEYLVDLKNNCERAIELTGAAPNATNPISVQELAGPVIEANPGNQWALGKVVLDAAANWCNDQTNEKWLGRIAAADVYGPDNAYIVIESLRIDYGVLGPFGLQP